MVDTSEEKTSPAIKWSREASLRCKHLESKGVKCRVEEMSPLQFLSKVPSPCREGVTADKDIDLLKCFSESSLHYIMKQIQDGAELEPPYIDYSLEFRGFPGHEGRHRALLAYRLGEKKIPVVIYPK